MNRLEAIVGHLAPPSSPSAPTTSLSPCSSEDRDEDVVIVTGWRSALGKGGRGGFKETPPSDLLAPLFQKILQETKIPPDLIEDVVIGNVAAYDAHNQVRIAAFLSGMPAETSTYVLNRACSSGLQAIASLHSSIHSGHVKIGIAGGVESMSTNKAPKSRPHHPSSQSSPQIAGCYWNMGQTSEEVSRTFDVGREKQDFYGLHSQKRAAEAQKKGIFAEEIVQIGGKDGKPVVADEGIRPKTNSEGLAKLKPAFHPNGCSTAGNSSQVSDGAAALLLMKRKQAKELGLGVMGKLVGFATAGVDPRVMGIGPAVAIPKVLEQTGLSISDIDLWEINEAFASQFAYTIESLKIPYDKVNVNGGAIALGHPLGATGARMTVHLLREMERRKAKYGVVSMCIGGGYGAAAVFERE